MIVVQHTFITALKAALLASILLVLVIMIHENIIAEWPFIFMLSYIVTFLIFAGILILILWPLYFLESKKISPKMIFNKYFPYYSIIFFSACLCIFFSLNLTDMSIGILLILYITSMQSWVWFFKDKQLEESKSKSCSKNKKT